MSKVIMAATVLTLSKSLTYRTPDASLVLCRTICTSGALCKNIRSGVPKVTTNRSKALTYEQACKPHHIGVRKSWNSWNASNLEGMYRHTAQTTVEDMFIRKFMFGTWPTLLASEVIIKRRHNMIIIAGLVTRREPPSKMYFLTGYTEEMLSLILKRPIKLEIQTVDSFKDTHFKFI